VHVVLIRHAVAVDETIELGDDWRYLSDDGREQAKNLGERLRWHDCVPTRVWSSPLVRAVQTAEILVANLHVEIQVEIVPELAGAHAVASVVEAIGRLPQHSLVLLVGHEPGLSAIGAMLVGDPDFEPLARASAVRIVDGHVRWRFDWHAEAPITGSAPAAPK